MLGEIGQIGLDGLDLLPRGGELRDVRLGGAFRYPIGGANLLQHGLNPECVLGEAVEHNHDLLIGGNGRSGWLLGV